MVTRPWCEPTAFIVFSYSIFMPLNYAAKKKAAANALRYQHYRRLMEAKKKASIAPS
jgi:hypothetical protein